MSRGTLPDVPEGNLRARRGRLDRLTLAIRVVLKRFAYDGIGDGRDRRLQPDRVVTWLGLRPGMRIADIGAGFGYFAFRFARAVGPDGLVLAVDTDPDLRAEVGREADRLGLPQVRPIDAMPDDPAIPEPVDLVFLSASFHHLPDRVRYFRQVRDRLRADGRVAILEPSPGRFDWLFGHTTDPAQVRAPLEAAGYRHVASADFLRGSSLQVFEPTDAPGPPGPGRDPIAG
jgi:SAM-dependent methyltransferase